jgi:hypothetical protein
MPKGNDIEKTETDIEIHPGYAKLNQLMQNVIAEVGEVEAGDIIEAILNAKTIDEVLGGGIVHVDDLIPGEDEIEIIDPHLRAQPSTFAGTDYYIVADVRVNGQPETLVTSSGNVIAQLFKMVELGALPQKLQIRKGHTQNGYEVYRFVAPRKRPVKA